LWMRGRLLKRGKGNLEGRGGKAVLHRKAPWVNYTNGSGVRGRSIKLVKRKRGGGVFPGATPDVFVFVVGKPGSKGMRKLPVEIQRHWGEEFVDALRQEKKEIC